MQLHYQRGLTLGAGPLVTRRLAAAIIGVPVGMATFSHVGISAAQAWTGSSVLFAAATGTDFYDIVLMLIPLLVVTCTLAGIAVLSITMAAMRRWPDTWAWVCPVTVVVWVAFLVSVFPRWDDVSP